MAKADDVSLFEQHMEKGVLLVAVLILGYAVIHWGISSPREVPVVRPNGTAMEVSAPDEVDAKLLNAAENIEKDIQKVEPAAQTLPDWKTVMESLQGRPFEPIPLIDPDGGICRRRVGQVDTVEVVLTLKSLAEKLPAPGKPTAWAGLVLPKKLPGNDKPNDVAACHAAVRYPLGELRRNWQACLQGSAVGLNLAVANIEAEAQTRNPDGSWPQQGKVVTMLANVAEPPPSLPEYTGANVEAVREVIKKLSDPVVQAAVLQPNFWDVWNAQEGKWVDWKSCLARLNVPAGNFEEQFTGTGDLGVWFHDASLEPLKEYRYRVRLNLVNPLLTHEIDLKEEHKQDGRVATVQTPWSEFSDPVSVEKTTKFFLIGASELTGSVRVKVYAQALGQWVDKAFQVSPGQYIGSLSEAKVVHPATGQSETIQVDFSTGAVAVEFDFNRKVLTGRYVKTTAAMIYLDETGRLVTRIRDDDSRELQEWEKGAKSPAAPAKTPAKTPAKPPAKASKTPAGRP